MNKFKNTDELLDYLTLICVDEYKDLEVVVVDSWSKEYKSITGVYKLTYNDDEVMFDYIGLEYKKDKKPFTLEELISALNTFKDDKSFIGLFDGDNINESEYPKSIYDLKLTEIETLGEKDMFLEIKQYD